MYLESLMIAIVAPILNLHNGSNANPLTGLDSHCEHIYPLTAQPSGLARNSFEAPAILNLDTSRLEVVAGAWWTPGLRCGVFRPPQSQEYHAPQYRLW